MVIKNRKYWQKLIEDLWREKSILWLSGVRRTGKTCLCQSVPGIEYFDCELPRTRRLMEDPESFLSMFKGKRIVLDEIHRLANPSELLKIAADYFPNVKIIATGSSTLGASAKFKDTLTGRKTEMWLTPMITEDLIDFGNTDIMHRLHRGGVPPFFLARKYPERDFQEWLDAYWAKDIQELFRLERRFSFQRFLELLFMQSGGVFEATKFARPCEVSRTTIHNYLSVLEATFVVQVIRPFNTYRTTEIISAPKVYSFDTGFICHYKGWESIRSEDLGLLWEHFVLNEIQARFQKRNLLYWRDKRHHELDFVLQKNSKEMIAVECKWSAEHFDPTSLKAFRHIYNRGQNYVVAHDVQRAYLHEYKGLKVGFVSLDQLISNLKTPIQPPLTADVKS